MYKLLLCWRYLRTRYIALVSIVSVMLGVATMIVVNSVMAGFSRDIEGQINGILGDIIVRVRSMDGTPDADKYISHIREIGGDKVLGVSPSVQVPALLYLGSNEQLISQQVLLMGIDENSYGTVSAFGDFLQHPSNRQKLSFALREDGYDTSDHTETDREKAVMRPQMRSAGWIHRRAQAALKSQRQLIASPLFSASGPVNPFGNPTDQQQGRDFDMSVEQHVGIVLGISVCDFMYADKVRGFHAIPGDDVRVSFPKATLPPEAINEFYTVVDFYESKYGEYDASLAFVPLRELQRSRGMIDPETGVGRFTAIQIKLAPGTDANAFRDLLRESEVFPVQMFQINSWTDEQGALLSAIWLEKTILNILLFLIIAVAGFGILAIFFMIVVEKTRDIGILKSLGASWWGILGIFLSYGFLLGLLGAGIGTYIGLKFVEHIQDIADLINDLTGYNVCDPSVYMFNKIPTVVEPFTVVWVCAGAVLIAVVASILPAIRAANLHPVRALRYE